MYYSSNPYPGGTTSSSSSSLVAPAPYQLPTYQPKPPLSERVADVSKETYTWLRDYVTAIK